jgi:hypothetical protein
MGANVVIGRRCREKVVDLLRTVGGRQNSGTAPARPAFRPPDVRYGARLCVSGVSWPRDAHETDLLGARPGDATGGWSRQVALGTRIGVRTGCYCSPVCGRNRGLVVEASTGYEVADNARESRRRQPRCCRGSNSITVAFVAGLSCG